jgi:hypothetical protein
MDATPMPSAAASPSGTEAYQLEIIGTITMDARPDGISTIVDHAFYLDIVGTFGMDATPIPSGTSPYSLEIVGELFMDARQDGVGTIVSHTFYLDIVGAFSMDATPLPSGVAPYSLDIAGELYMDARPDGTGTVVTHVFYLDVTGELSMSATPGPTSVGGPGSQSRYAGTASGTGWTSASNATAVEDNVYATSAVPAAGDPDDDPIVLTNFSFTIPTGAVIDGITFQVKCKAAELDKIADGNTDYPVQVTKDGSSGVGDTLDIGDYIGTHNKWFLVYGSAANLLGTTWTAAEINASTFGLILSFINTAINPKTISVDAVLATVTYH